MTQGKITQAYKAVCDMYKVKGLPFSLSSKLFQLKRKLQPFVEHQQDQEIALLEEWDALNPDGTLNITVENVNPVNNGMSKIQMSDIEWNENILKIVLNEELAEKLSVTGELIDKVDGFIEFEEEGDE